MGNVLVARDGSAWAHGAVVMRRGVLQYLMGSPRGWLRRHVGKGSEVSDGSTGRRLCPRFRRNLCAVLFLFFLRVTRTRQRMYVVATARCLGKRCDCRDCYGTDDWNEHADKFSLRTALEGVSSRLEVQRQVDEISAAQCRKRVLAETNYSLRERYV